MRGEPFFPLQGCHSARHLLFLFMGKDRTVFRFWHPPHHNILTFPLIKIPKNDWISLTYSSSLFSYLLQLAEMEARVVGAETRAEIAEEKVS